MDARDDSTDLGVSRWSCQLCHRLGRCELSSGKLQGMGTPDLRADGGTFAKWKNPPLSVQHWKRVYGSALRHHDVGQDIQGTKRGTKRNAQPAGLTDRTLSRSRRAGSRSRAAPTW